MKIPGDNGKDFRFNKFIEYQHKVAPLDPTTLLYYAEREHLTPDECVLLCLLHSAVYCEVTAIFLFETIDWQLIDERRLNMFWNEHKPNLQFNSSRRYAKNMNWFVPICVDFLRRIRGAGGAAAWAGGYVSLPNASLAWKLCNPLNAELHGYKALREQVEKIVYTGHFASGRFMEPLLWMAMKEYVPFRMAEPEQLPWKIGANETSGLMNIIGWDEEADEYDRSGKLPSNADFELNFALERLHRAIWRKYPSQIGLRCAAQGKLCSFRNLFKGRRYGGFHHDRQLENLRKYEAAYPSKTLWNRLYKIRRQLFVPQLLGEVGGWDGVRKDRNKLWLTKGLTGVEA